jgi:hypothetical protein
MEHPRSAGGSCLHFLQRTRFVEFAFAQDRVHMPRDHRHVAAEQIGHLRLGHPQRFAVEAQFHARSRRRAVDQEAVAGRPILEDTHGLAAGRIIHRH